jgi:xanthine dehydrogenase accessory factor
MKTWAHIVKALEVHGTCTMVTVVRVEGSAPREVGARMIVTPQGYHGSIGGGTLEWHAMAKAQSLLGQAMQQKLSSHSLGPDLGQCCGGRVQLVTEVFDHSRLADARNFSTREAEGTFTLQGRIFEPTFVEHFGDEFRKLYLFGAGHVGRALVLALAPLPFDITWIDQRDGAFPAAVPANVKTVQSPTSVSEMAQAPVGSFALVMTHSHALDFEIVDAALRDNHFAFVGVIGSTTKRARFVSLLRDGHVQDSRIAELACPIGISSIKSKHPAAIAAAVVAQLIERDELLRSHELPLADRPSLDKVAPKRRA